MAEEKRQEVTLAQAYIPANYSGVVNLLGLTFVLKNLIEGIVFAFVMFFVGFEFGYWTLVIDSSAKNAMIGLIFAVFGLLFGIMGVNKGDAFSFLMCLFKSLSNRRIAKYNPRVKYEAAVERSVKNELDAFYGTKKTEEYKSYWQRLVEKVKGKNIEGAQARDAARKQLDTMAENSEYVMFSDDVNVVNKREKHKRGLFGRKEDDDAEEE